jgi:predicted DNA binding protein
MADEVWKPVVGYEGLYEVSSLGRVRSNHASSRRKDPILKDANLRGYRMVMLCKGDGTKPKSALIHRLVATAFLGPAPDVRRPTVNHKNLRKSDNRVENLEWLSQADNVRHAAPHTPRLRGEANHSKLTELQVREIRQRYIPHQVTLRQLGDEYGVSEQTIFSIIRRQKWAHVS